MKQLVVGSAAVIATLGFLSPSVAGVILPAEGSPLNYLHVRFRWEPSEFFGDPNALYQLVLVVDNGNEDPFAGAPIVLNLAFPGLDPHETIVTTGLEFGKDYAWHVRGFLYDPQPWGPTHRFSTVPLPDYVPELAVTSPAGVGEIEPGVTLVGGIFSQAGNVPDSGGLFLGIEESGRIIWHHTVFPRGFGPDLRLVDNGRIQWVGAGDRAYETTLSGDIIWASPELFLPDPKNHPAEFENKVHHDCFPMPNGDRMVMFYVWQDVERDGQKQRWRGDRIVVLDRQTNEEVWSWSTFDHFSTLDFDETVMSAPLPTGEYNWTHSNAVVYNEADNSVYLSTRNLSRITRIDYATGDIIWNAGFDMPSGETDFGDNLFSFEHGHEVLPNGNVVLFDNGNRRDHMDQTPKTGVSKAIEIEITGNPPSDASIVWEWTVPAYNAFLGDADRQPGGNTLVTTGGVATVVEVDANSQVVWNLEIVAGGAPLWAIYRAERVASLILDTPADTDGDWDVDLLDFGRAQACFTGAGPAGLDFPCSLSDVDGDDDVDLDDVAVLIDTSTGPLRPGM